MKGTIVVRAMVLTIVLDPRGLEMIIMVFFNSGRNFKVHEGFKRPAAAWREEFR